METRRVHRPVRVSRRKARAILAAVIAGAEGAGFETRDVESLREHYALTFARGSLPFTKRREAIRLTDERTFRTWRLYMAGSAHGFARPAALNVVQTLLAKPDACGRVPLPLTRRAAGFT